MEYSIGVVLAFAVCMFALLSGFDSDRAFYATVLIVVAHYYVLFAVMGGSLPALVMESLGATCFVTLAVVGFKTNSWLVAASLAGHGVFDFFHHMLIQNPGVPVWWPGFCLSFDVAAGMFVAVLLMRRSANSVREKNQ